MNRVKFLFLSVFIFIQFHVLYAQNDSLPVNPYYLVADSLVNNYNDAFQYYKKITMHQKSTTETLNNPYYFYLFSSPTFYVKPITRQTSLVPTIVKKKYLLPTLTISQKKLLNQIDNTLINIYTYHPQLIQNNEDAYIHEEGLRKDVNVEVKPQVKLSEKISETTTVSENLLSDDMDIVVRKPNFWTFYANFSLQFMQSYYSDNWYKGGENFNSWKTEMILTANYNNKQRLIFENKLEMRLGFQSSHGDEKHKYRSNSDLVRLTNKLGLQASKRWYYTVTLQSWTQFYPGYKKNDTKVYSDFMSPFESLFTIGMDYKLNTKNFNMDASLSPLASKFKYVHRDALVTSFGLEEGKHSNFEYGSNITINYTWNICNNVSWRGRVYYFTDYSKSQIEWENTFNLKINKFLTTKLFIYPRFDDSVNRQEDDSYFQLNETLSIGFDYTF